MRIIIDGHGGDNAPEEVLLGCAMALDEFPDLELTISGTKDLLTELIEEYRINKDRLTILEADGGMPPDAEPTDILKGHDGCSMAVGLKALAAGEGKAFVSGGNTGALTVGGTLLVGRKKGIKRPALATIIPCKGGNGAYMLLDVGANVECRPEMLLQFGEMASEYMSKVMNVRSPRVGLVNIGTEEEKGTPLQREAFSLFKASGLNFIGNAEPRDIPNGICDVAVADGYTGNIMLKLTEGLSSFLMGSVKGILMGRFKNKLAALMLKKDLDRFKKQLDYTEYGGAPLLGLSSPVIKAHGSSNAKAFKNAIRQAINMSK